MNTSIALEFLGAVLMLSVFLSLGTTGLLNRRHKLLLIFAGSLLILGYACAVRTFYTTLNIPTDGGDTYLVCDRTQCSVTMLLSADSRNLLISKLPFIAIPLSNGSLINPPGKKGDESCEADGFFTQCNDAYIR